MLVGAGQPHHNAHPVDYSKIKLLVTWEEVQKKEDLCIPMADSY